eukprot:CAMPEP_0194030582 /NCGR_PEP_ID=MMETSP0009_2-20130614/4009_1 /TAXON_ID=210454 /ORGANISM="Grammatophora oceanica, Strain CCMP 410" /LENGTH=245 /DNA_ID=CAMNT_0038670553 /DNA_START=73 /DNA_END=810 /DNA_ORIENTATION=-
MKISAALVLAAIGGASAFVPRQPALTRMSKTIVFEDAAEDAEAEAEPEPEPEPTPAAPTMACISKSDILAAPNTLEFGSVWDPLGLADIGSDETLAWYRHSEIKHGRIAMAAFVGWWAVAAGARLPGMLAFGTDFSSLPAKGLDAWDAVPGWGKAQMLLFAGLIEFHDELFHSKRGTHYLRGGTPGKNMVPGLFDPFNLSGSKTEEAKARGRDVEIKNGRLAMIGIAGLYFQSVLPGSVPLQPDC